MNKLKILLSSLALVLFISPAFSNHQTETIHITPDGGGKGSKKAMKAVKKSNRSSFNKRNRSFNRKTRGDLRRISKINKKYQKNRTKGRVSPC